MKKLLALAGLAGIVAATAAAQPPSATANVYLTINAYGQVSFNGSLYLTGSGSYTNGYTTASGTVGYVVTANNGWSMSFSTSGVTLPSGSNLDASTGASLLSGSATPPAGSTGTVTMQIDNISSADGTYSDANLGTISLTFTTV